MDDRFNTAAGWVLFSGIVALGLSSVSAKYFSADKPHRPHEMGYPIEGVVEEGATNGKPDRAWPNGSPPAMSPRAKRRRRDVAALATPSIRAAA